jgi:hypothetical protein
MRRKVRFTPESGHVRPQLRCALCANSGREPIVFRPLLHMGYSLRKFLSGVLSLSNGHAFDTVFPTLLRGLLLLLISPATARDLQ